VGFGVITVKTLIKGQVVSEQEYEIVRRRLAEQFGTPPSDRDICWALLNTWASDDIRQRNMSLYRNRRFQQAEILRSVDKRLDLALETLLVVCYIDLNGPEFTGGNPKLPMFVPGKRAQLAHGVMEIVVRLVRKLGIDAGEVDTRFLKAANEVQRTLGTPVSPQKAAKEFGAALRELLQPS
jgi:hypothetical protein